MKRQTHLTMMPEILSYLKLNGVNVSQYVETLIENEKKSKDAYLYFNEGFPANRGQLHLTIEKDIISNLKARRVNMSALVEKLIIKDILHHLLKERGVK